MAIYGPLAWKDLFSAISMCTELELLEYACTHPRDLPISVVAAAAIKPPPFRIFF